MSLSSLLMNSARVAGALAGLLAAAGSNVFSIIVSLVRSCPYRKNAAQDKRDLLARVIEWLA
jgi:hypothetical protein